MLTGSEQFLVETRGVVSEIAVATGQALEEALEKGRPLRRSELTVVEPPARSRLGSTPAIPHGGGFVGAPGLLHDAAPTSSTTR